MKLTEKTKARNEIMKNTLKVFLQSNIEFQPMIAALQDHKGKADVRVGKMTRKGMQVHLTSYINNLYILISKFGDEPQVLLYDFQKYRQSIAAFNLTLIDNIEYEVESGKVKQISFSYNREIDYCISLIS